MPVRNLVIPLVLTVTAALPLCALSANHAVTPEEARVIAKEAYIYGYPLVDSYRIQYAYFVDKDDKSYKAPWNQLTNIPAVYTPADTAIQTPNSDTPYSFVGLDLRAEPIVISVPKIDKKRYYSIQLIDAYTFNFAYIGSRTTGNDASSFLIAGPSWKGEKPAGIKEVIRSETDFDMVMFRTQLFNPADLDNVKQIQAQYQVQPLSAFLGQPAPAAASVIAWVKPLSKEEQKSSLEFFNVLNFVLGFTPTVPSEVELMQRFAKIGVGAGMSFDPATLSADIKTAIEAGRADAYEAFAAQVKLLNNGTLTSGQLFGSREFLKNNYLYRWVATIGIYGNSKQEAMYPIYRTDAQGELLSGANRYTLHFSAGEYPPVNAFWSLTMYQLPESLLVANSINRYLINSPMLPELQKDAEGGLTIYIQHESPGKDKESNWLPAPAGPFAMYMRLYWPAEAALDGSWSAPKLSSVK